MKTNYIEYLKTLIGRRGRLEMPIDVPYYTLRFNESNDGRGNAHLLKVQDYFVVIHHDLYGKLEIPHSGLFSLVIH